MPGGAVAPASVDLRLVWRAHHYRGIDGRYVHELFGPEAVRADAAMLSAEEIEWPRQTARLAASWPAAEVTVSRPRSNIAAATQVSIPNATLVSWVLAPVRRA